MPRKGNTTARGYGHHHQQLRAAVRRYVLAGTATCWRCGEKIQPTESFDLGHHDTDRTRYMGPEHTRCNRGAAARKQHDTAPATDHTRRW